MAAAKKATGKREEQKKETRRRAYKIEEIVNFGIETGVPVRIIAPHGTGKTSYVRATLAERDVTMVYLSLTQASTENLGIPVPSVHEMVGPDGELEMERVLDFLLFENLENDAPKVLVFDEFSRADRRTANAAMEIINEKTLFGKRIPGLVTTIALDNPSGDGMYFVGGLDLAQASRFVTVELTANDIPWREALSRKYEQIDLEPVFDVWEDQLDPVGRLCLPPRVLDFMIGNALDGLPLELALPVVAGPRAAIVDGAGVDITDKVLGKIADVLGVPAKATMSNQGVAIIESALRQGVNARLISDSGFGKTAYTKSSVPEGYDAIYLSLAQSSTEDLGIPVPTARTTGDEDSEVTRVLDFLLFERFTSDRPKVLILDEFSRAGRRVANAAMELINERTLFGKKIPGLVSVIALDNPTGQKLTGADGVAGQMYDVGKLDPAQASRFAITGQLRATDIPWRDWLLATYGDDAKPFIDWWAEKLDDTGRKFANARVLERMILLFRKNLDVAMALPVVGGKRVRVEIGSLRSMLAGKRVVGMRTIVAEAPQWIDSIEDGDLEALATVQEALGSADLAALKELVEGLKPIVGALPRQSLYSLVRGNGDEERQRFWSKLITAVVSEKGKK